MFKALSKCERDFVNNVTLLKEKRLDGRFLSDGRNLEIEFGNDWGCCIVSLGNTRVLTVVTSEIGEPKSNAPTEGALHINFEFSSMATPDNDRGRITDESNELQRCLERCVRDSKCIDLESLCILAGSKVWIIKVNVHGLNDDGNLIECASLAAIAALAHFRRPDVTVVGTEVTIHTIDDRDPVPLNIHHMPICVNLALFNHGEQIMVDPTNIEEKVCDGCYILGINSHQELCFVHLQGILLLSEDIIEKCENIALKQVQSLTQIIRKAIDDDSYARATKAPVGLGCKLVENVLASKLSIKGFALNTIPPEITDTPEAMVATINDTSNPQSVTLKESSAKLKALEILKKSQSSTMFEGGKNKWGVELSSDEDSEDEITVPLKRESESEEEDNFIENNQLDGKPSQSRSWYSKNPFSGK